MGSPVRVVDLARRFAAAHGLELTLSGGEPGTEAKPGTLAMVETGARPGEKLHEILAQPGEVLDPTPHPAVRSWTGAIPDSEGIKLILDRTSVRSNASREVVVEAIRRSVVEVDQSVANAVGGGNCVEFSPSFRR